MNNLASENKFFREVSVLLFWDIVQYNGSISGRFNFIIEPKASPICFNGRCEDIIFFWWIFSSLGRCHFNWSVVEVFCLLDSMSFVNCLNFYNCEVAALWNVLFLVWLQALVMQGKHAEAVVELSKICLVWRIFPPEESSVCALFIRELL